MDGTDHIISNFHAINDAVLAISVSMGSIIFYVNIKWLLLHIFVMSLKVGDGGELQTTPKSSVTSTTKYILPRYNRYMFFYFSKNVTYYFYESIVNQLAAFDNYCGGENIRLRIFINSSPSSDCSFCTIQGELANNLCSSRNQFMDCNQDIDGQNVTVGSIDANDVGHVSFNLIKNTKPIYTESFSTNDSDAVTTQVILVIDYIPESLRNASTIDALNNLKVRKNVKFIALITNITNETILDTYFPQHLWAAYPNFTGWTPDNGVNPICNYQTHQYSKFSSLLFSLRCMFPETV